LNSSWGVTNGEMFPLDKLLEVARPGDLEIIEKPSDEDI
jgi:hypothetical protein